MGLLVGFLPFFTKLLIPVVTFSDDQIFFFVLHFTYTRGEKNEDQDGLRIIGSCSVTKYPIPTTVNSNPRIVRHL